MRWEDSDTLPWGRASACLNQPAAGCAWVGLAINMRGYSTQLKSGPLTVRRITLSMCVMHMSVIILCLVPDTVDTATQAANIPQALEWNGNVPMHWIAPYSDRPPSYLTYGTAFLPHGSTARFPAATWSLIFCCAQTGWEPTQPFVQCVPRVFPHVMPWSRISGSLPSWPELLPWYS